MNVLDKPDTLDETVWAQIASCAKCNHPAQYRVTGTCCNRAMNVCGDCEAATNAKWSMQIALTGGMACTRCRATFRTVEDAVTVRVI